MALSAKLVPNDALGALGAERDGLTSAEAAKRIEDGGDREEGDWQELGGTGDICRKRGKRRVVKV